MKPIQIRNGVIVYYGNRAGMVQDKQAVVDPMFEREDLKDFLNRQRDIREIKWQNGIFDRLANHKELSPGQPSLKNVRVWQLKPDVDIRMKFISYEEMCRQFGPPNAEQYQLVYDGAVETNDLEALYMKFNTEWPEGYTGHSLSMSDVLELYDREGSSFHYVDRFGFQKVDLSFPEQAMTTSHTMRF